MDNRLVYPLDRTMILFGDVVEVFDLPDDHRRALAGIDLVDRRFVRTALVHRDFFRHAGLHGLSEKAFCYRFIPACRQQKIDRLSFLIHFTIEILPDAFDLYIGLIHFPTRAYQALVFAERFLK